MHKATFVARCSLATAGTRALADVRPKSDTELGACEYEFQCECSYETRVPGEHKALVHYDELLLPRCPLPFRVLPGRDPRVVVHAEGEGLEDGFARQWRQFQVFFEEAVVESLQVKVQLEGQTRDAPWKESSRDELSSTVEYKPMEAGHYSIHVLVNQLDIRGSPFRVSLADWFNVHDVRLEPPAEDYELRVGELCRLRADLTASGHKPFSAYAYAINSNDVSAPEESPLDVRPLSADGLSFHVLLTPTAQGIARSPPLAASLTALLGTSVRSSASVVLVQ